MHVCYERPGLVTALNGGVGYDKWDRGGGGAGGGGAAGAAWAGRERETRDARDTRDRERDRERERQARAHQMSHAHAAEPDASSLFPAPFKVTGHTDRMTQQIQTKLGDYDLAQILLDDPSKSIGICAEPASPAPCHPSRRESEFKKPAHAPHANGRVHHRPYVYNKSEGLSSTGAAAHRPPPLRIPNGFQGQHNIDSSQPPIESILKEMKSLPTPLSVIAATPRKELENKFIFNPYTNKVQENPQLANNDLKTPITKPGLDNRISHSRSSASPDVVNKDLGLSESDDEAPATTTRLEPILSPIGSGGSPSSGSESSPSDSESESSSAESTAAPPPAPAPPPAQRYSWGLSNFVPPLAQPADHAESYDAGKELRHALDDVKGKPSPISELSDSEASSPSPSAVRRRRRSLANRISTASSDEDTPRQNTTARTQPSPATTSSSGVKRGRPPKPRVEEEPAKKKRGRPRKSKPSPAAPPAQPPSPRAPPAPAAAPAPAPAPPFKGALPSAAPDSDPEPEPAVHQDPKTFIFRKVFTPRKNDEGGGKGGKGGKGKGGKGKRQVTIIEVTPESGADDDDRRERRNEEAVARLSPPHEPEPPSRRRDPERTTNERTDRPDRPTDRPERPSNDRLPPDRTDRTERTDRTAERLQPDRTQPDRRSIERLQSERMMAERLQQERLQYERLQAERLQAERLQTERLQTERLQAERLQAERLQAERLQAERLQAERLQAERLQAERLQAERLASERIAMEKLSAQESRLSSERLVSDKMERISAEKRERLSGDKSHDRLSDKMAVDCLPGDKVSLERVDLVERIAQERYVRAEADVGSGLKSGRGSERLEDGSSTVRGRTRVMVRIALSRLRSETVRAIQRPPRRAQPPRVPTPPQDQSAEAEELSAARSPVYYSYFERLPPDALSDDERDHKYYMDEAKRMRIAAEREQEPLARVMLYHESVLCFVLTGRLLEVEMDTKKAFTIYRETIEYIKSIHSMPQRFRTSPKSPHSTFSKLDILSLRVQALLYLRMFKMYNREVKEYNKVVQEYQQKPACAESVSSVSSASPLSPTPSPAGSSGGPGSVGSGSSGYCSLVHSVPAHAHHALLQLTKYYTFLYVAHELWEQADVLCRLRPNQDLFIAVDRKCGPLTLFSTFRHLVQYVRYAMSLLKAPPRE